MQFLGWENGGPGVTFSSVAESDLFKKGEMPMPIILADQRDPGEVLVTENTTIFEFTLLEFGSFDPSVQEFTPLKTLGTDMTGGVPVDNNTCIRGFDNAGSAPPPPHHPLTYH